MQQALAAELDLQGIYDLVGDKIREIFDTGDMGIRIYDRDADMMHYPLRYEHGERFPIEPTPLARASRRTSSRTREPLVINENIGGGGERSSAASRMPGTRPEKSASACRWWPATRCAG